MFVDSDDVVSLGLLEQLMKYMSNGIDIVECDRTEAIQCLNEEKKIFLLKNLIQMKHYTNVLIME